MKSIEPHRVTSQTFQLIEIRQIAKSKTIQEEFYSVMSISKLITH